METLVTAIAYLWLVLTFLLVLMWILRDQDRRRKSQREQDAKDELLAAAAVDQTPPTEVDEPQTDSPEPGDKPIAERRPTVDRLLDGITLTHDLVPLTARIEDPDRHAIFISSHPEPAEVGTAFADELANQGFEIEPAGFDQALARRDGDLLSLRISPDADQVTDGTKPRYPTAKKGDIAIEVWVGNGSPPPLTD